MKIRMNTTAAGPEGTLDAGAVVNVPDAKAKALIKDGLASPAEPEAKVNAEYPFSTAAAEK